MSGYDFKKEEEVKEFIKNIGIEYRFGCYKENNPEACQLLGDYLESIEMKREKAYEVYKKNCDENNFAHSCSKYGTHLIAGSNIEDPAALNLAAEYTSKGCDFGYLESCCTAGKLGIKLIKDANKSAPESTYSKYVTMLKKSCKEEHTKQEESCFILGSFYLEMLNFKEAVAPLEKSCELNNPYACANLAMMYKKGDGVKTDQKLEEEYKAKTKELWKELTRSKNQLKFQQGLPTS